MLLQKFGLKLVVSNGLSLVRCLLLVLGLALQLTVKGGFLGGRTLDQATQGNCDLLSDWVLDFPNLSAVNNVLIQEHVHIEHVVDFLTQVRVEHVLVLLNKLQEALDFFEELVLWF